MQQQQTKRYGPVRCLCEARALLTPVQWRTVTNDQFHVDFKPGTHWQQTWIQHGRLRWKSTVAVRITLLPVFGNKSATTWIRQLVAVDFVANTIDFVASACVRGQSDTVDFLDFQQSRPRWIQLCRKCVPGFRCRLTSTTHHRCARTT